MVRKAAAGAGFAAGMYVGEDVDFVWRMAAAGWRVRYEPAAVMGHDHRVRFRAWFGRRRDYGTSAAALEQLHPGVVRPLYTSWWTACAGAAALSGLPGIAVTLTGTATALLAQAPVPGHRRTLATARGFRCPAWVLAVRFCGGGTLAGRAAAGQRAVADVVAGRHPGGGRGPEAALAGRGADPRAATARLGGSAAAARPRPLRHGPAAR